MKWEPDVELLRFYLRRVKWGDFAPSGHIIRFIPYNGYCTSEEGEDVKYNVRFGTHLMRYAVAVVARQQFVAIRYVVVKPPYTEHTRIPINTNDMTKPKAPLAALSGRTNSINPNECVIIDDEQPNDHN